MIFPTWGFEEEEADALNEKLEAQGHLSGEDAVIYMAAHFVNGIDNSSVDHMMRKAGVPDDVDIIITPKKVHINWNTKQKWL